MDKVSKKNKHVVKCAEDEPFHPDTFDPKKNKLDWQYLYMLRNVGWARARKLKKLEENGLDKIPYPNKFASIDSLAMQELNFEAKFLFEGKKFLDIGCGSSPDCRTASLRGASESIGMDLFPSGSFESMGQRFIQADVSKHIPLEDKSVDYVLSQAMIDLVPHDRRYKLYSEVYRVLKKDGLFSICGINLARGHGTNMTRESVSIKAAGFIQVRHYSHVRVFEKKDLSFVSNEV